MARPSWQGEIRLPLGFPIKVAAYSMIRSKSADSFKMLDPVHKMPVSQKLVDHQGNPVERGDTLRGVEVYDGICVLPPDALKQIQEGERTKALSAETFPPKHTVPLHLATGHYELGPPEKAPEAGDSLNVLWNGLWSTDRVLVTEWTKRAGARPAPIAIEATEDGLVAHEFPYATDIQRQVEWRPEENERAAALFGQFIEASMDANPFEWSELKDRYRERRDALVEAALSGDKVAFSDEKPPADPVPDLMAALEAQVAAASKQKAGRFKKETNKKPAAKSSASKGRKKVTA